MAIMAGVRSPAQLKANIKTGLLPMQKISWVISPCSMIFAQNFLPITTWVPFFNFIAFRK
jgi:peroxisomal membrane protein 2